MARNRVAGVAAVKPALRRPPAGRGHPGIAITRGPGHDGARIATARMDTQIKTALVALLAAIQRGDGPVIAAEMTTLDDCLARGRATGGLHPQLEHFLGNRSYAKALAFLGGAVASQGATPPGGCSSHRKPAAQG